MELVPDGIACQVDGAGWGWGLTRLEVGNLPLHAEPTDVHARDGTSGSLPVGERRHYGSWPRSPTAVSLWGQAAESAWPEPL